jgi:hypothetical protein
LLPLWIPVGITVILTLLVLGVLGVVIDRSARE